MENCKNILIYFILVFSLGGSVQALAQNLPEIGAQVFIEPGQTEADTELWFKTLAENGMSVCRIRMFESYMLQEDGTWDFSLFDRAFEMADKYNIKVMGTFFPATEKTDIGGWKFPKDELQLKQFQEYIKQLTLHFQQYKSLYAWVLINEPGGGLKDTPFSQKMRMQWDKENPQPEYLPNGYPVLVDLQNDRFKMFMTSWMLNWIAGEVRKHDKNIHLHVNNHAIFSNLPEYDFVYWRSFLNSLGGSAHPSWHFSDFTRNQYALAMSANSEIILSGAGNLPWLMTEIQGGNNTYSAGKPMCPTAEEITQWLWVIIGTEGKGGIFWSLNPRASGVESGEWALLDFQHQPTDRVQSIKEITTVLKNNKTLFDDLKKVDSGINLLYIRESYWTENVITAGTPASSDGRKSGFKNILGYFKALTEMGVNANLKAFEEFDFDRKDFSNTTIILSHQIALPKDYVSKLEHFVEKGGKLIVDGLTGYYDENVHNQMLTGFPYEKLFGGNISEFKYLESPVKLAIGNSGAIVPGFGWEGIIRKNENSAVLAKDGDNVLAIRNQFGDGEVLWIPTMLGMAAWQVDTKPLARFLNEELHLENQPFLFDKHREGMIMKTLKSGDSFITIIINKSAKTEKIEIVSKLKLSPKIICADKGVVSNRTLSINPEETMVIEWN